MANDPVITSRQNPIVKAVARLWTRSAREEENRFLIEGFREITRAVENDVWIDTLCVCPDLFKSDAHPRLVESARVAEVEVLAFGPDAFHKISHREGADGLLAVAARREFLLEGAALPQNPLVLVIEQVEKPGNLGAMLRTADAAGVDCVICCDPVVDLYNPNVIRSSQGIVFALPVFTVPSAKAISYLRHAGLKTVATTPAGDRPLWDLDLSGPVAIVLGSEKDGLSDTWLKAADQRARIPMAGCTDSLNVSVSAAVCLFESARQRNRALPSPRRSRSFVQHPG